MEYLFVVILSFLSLALMFLLCKLMGNKQLSQLSMFDYVIGITVGSIAAEMATELETPLRSAVAMAVYGVTAFLISILSCRSLRLRKLFAGRPILLLDNGVIYKKNMLKARLDVSDFLTLARVAGYYDIGDIQTAILEENGAVSFLPKAEARPVEPRDLMNFPKQETIQTNVILDGVVLWHTLKAIGRSEDWLQAELKTLGYANPRQIYLAFCSEEGKLSVFPMNEEKKAFSPFD